MKQQHIGGGAVAAVTMRAVLLKRFDDALTDRAGILFVGSAPYAANESRGDYDIPA